MGDSPPAVPPAPPLACDDGETLLRLLREEEHRLIRTDALAADPARLAAGWERRFVADGARAAEAVALYETLGFEVAADPIAGFDLPPDCADCRLAALLAFRTIYTRRPKESPR